MKYELTIWRYEAEINNVEMSAASRLNKRLPIAYTKYIVPTEKMIVSILPQ